MAFNLRVFGYDGIYQMQQAHVRQYNSDSVFVVDDPPIWSQVAVSNDITPVSIVANLAPGVVDRARILGVEVPNGQTIRYELQPGGPLASNARVAGNLSRSLSGFDFIPWTPGGAFSFVDAANLP